MCPILIMMVFIRTERESDCPRHMLATTQMVPYFFASAHVNNFKAWSVLLRSWDPFQQTFGHCVCNVTTQRYMFVVHRIQPGMTCSLIQQHVCVMGTFKVV